MVSDQPRAVGRAPRSDATDEMLTTAIVAELPRLRRHALYLSYNHAFLQPRGCRRSGPGLPRSSPEQEGVAARSREAAQLAVLDSQQFLSHAAAFRSAAWANVADRGFRGQPRGIGLVGRSAIGSRSRPRDGQALRRTSLDFAPSERRRIWLPGGRGHLGNSNWNSHVALGEGPSPASGIVGRPRIASGRLK